MQFQDYYRKKSKNLNDYLFIEHACLVPKIKT